MYRKSKNAIAPSTAQGGLIVATGANTYGNLPLGANDAGRFQRRLHVGIERSLVANHFELHPIRQPNFAPPRRAARIASSAV